MGNGLIMLADEAGADIVAGAQTAISSVTAALNIGTVGKLIAAGLGAAVGLYLLWFAVRWIVKTVRKGMAGKLAV